MARSVGRSAISGRFVKTSTIHSHPKTTVTQKVPSGAKGSHTRSVISGRYISSAAAARHPRNSIREG
jgi:hypothetical protein